MPTTYLLDENFQNEEIGILNLLVLCKLCGSNSQARTLINQGGILVNDVKITSSEEKIEKSKFKEGVKIKKGKKVFHLAKLK